MRLVCRLAGLERNEAAEPLQRNEEAEPLKQNEAVEPLKHHRRFGTCNANSHVGALFSHGRPQRDKMQEPTSQEECVQEQK